jgi:hypothetical protein
MRHPLGNEVWFLWERLSASSLAAGKPLPQGCKKAASLEGQSWRCASSRALILALGRSRPFFANPYQAMKTVMPSNSGLTAL